MKCWACSKDTMTLREDERNYECSRCGATENIGGGSDTEHPKKKK